MDVGAYIFRYINLYNPVNCREINTSGSDIRAEKCRLFLLYELEIDCCSFVLVLLPM